MAGIGSYCLEDEHINPLNHLNNFFYIKSGTNHLINSREGGATSLGGPILCVFPYTSLTCARSALVFPENLIFGVLVVCRRLVYRSYSRKLGTYISQQNFALILSSHIKTILNYFSLICHYINIFFY